MFKGDEACEGHYTVLIPACFHYNIQYVVMKIFYPSHFTFKAAISSNN